VEGGEKGKGKGKIGNGGGWIDREKDYGGKGARRKMGKERWGAEWVDL